MMHRKKHRGLALLTAAGGLTLLLGRTDRLTTVTYPVNTGKLIHPLRLALVTDLHSCRYGTDQQELTPLPVRPLTPFCWAATF